MWKPDFTRRDRTNICVIPVEDWNKQSVVTSGRFPHAQIVDWRSTFLDGTRNNQRLLNLNVDLEIERLRRLGNSEPRIFAVINTEYLLAGFDEESRKLFWARLYGSLPYLKGIIILTVLATKDFLPDEMTTSTWERGGRFINLGKR